MATQYETPSQNGNNTGIIILAVLIIAAIAVAAAIYLSSGAGTNTSNTTVERYTSTVEKVPAQVGEAARDAADTVTVNPQPAPSPVEDQPVVSEPAPTPVPAQ
jgi:hypothetical protein